VSGAAAITEAATAPPLVLMNSLRDTADSSLPIIASVASVRDSDWPSGPSADYRLL
jgi:hypothetical protein